MGDSTRQIGLAELQPNDRGSEAVALVMLLAVALLACGGGMSKKLDPPESTDVSFVYGYIDMEDAPTSLDWVNLHRVAPQSEEPYYNMRVEDGVFYQEMLLPGSYVLASFGGGGGFFTRPHTYAVPRQDNPVRMVVNAPGIYFMGNWKYRDVETGIFEQGKFNIEPAAGPSQRELVEKILPHAEGTVWEQRLRGHLAQLR